MLAFSNDYYGMIFRATQSVELFCAYSFEKEQSGENFLKIRYDKETIRKIKSRKAGAKSIKLKRKISIKEVEKWIDVTTAKEVAEELGVSRSTLFRRIKEAKKQGVDYIE